MASDLALVLPSAHRRLQAQAERCARPARGMDDPASELSRELTAHVQAALNEVYQAEAITRLLAADDVERLSEVAHEVRVELTARLLDPTVLERLTATLVETEQRLLLPALSDGLAVSERRRLGKVFRLRRDAALKSGGTARRHRTSSHSELYERARRAGISHRSRMTVSELEQALRDRPEAPA